MTSFLIRLYGRLLHLYPHNFYAAFGAEMQITFAEALNEAKHRGWIAMLHVCLRELIELPANVAREHRTPFQKGKTIMATTPDFDARPTSWLGTCIGLLPFLIFGPVATMLAYPYPYPAESFPSWFIQNRAVIFAAGFLIGLVLGWLSNWQRWSFSYLGLGVMILLVQVGMNSIIALSTIILVAALLLIRGRRSLQSLSSQIPRDWTPLSFGLSIVAATMFSGGGDHTEDPNLTLLVILPGVIIVLSALAYLRSRNKSQRIWSLVLGITLLIIVSTVRHWFFILYGILAVEIVFLPALLELIPQQNKPTMAE